MSTHAQDTAGGGVTDEIVLAAVHAYEAQSGEMATLGDMRAALEAADCARAAAVADLPAAPGEAVAFNITDLSEAQITAARGVLVYHLGGSQQKWTLGDHNDEGGYGIPLTEQERFVTNLSKNGVIDLILRIAQLPPPSRPVRAVTLEDAQKAAQHYHGEIPTTYGLHRDMLAALQSIGAVIDTTQGRGG